MGCLVTHIWVAPTFQHVQRMLLSTAVGKGRTPGPCCAKEGTQAVRFPVRQPKALTPSRRRPSLRSLSSCGRSTATSSARGSKRRLETLDLDEHGKQDILETSGTILDFLADASLGSLDTAASDIAFFFLHLGEGKRWPLTAGMKFAACLRRHAMKSVFTRAVNCPIDHVFAASFRHTFFESQFGTAEPFFRGQCLSAAATARPGCARALSFTRASHLIFSWRSSSECTYR